MKIQFVTVLYDFGPRCEDLEVLVSASVYRLDPAAEGTSGYEVNLNSIRGDELAIGLDEITEKESERLREEALETYRNAQ